MPAQVLRVLAEHPLLVLLIPAVVFLTVVASVAAGLVCATAVCRWIRARDDLPEDERLKLIIAAIRRFFRLRDLPSQLGVPPDTAVVMTRVCRVLVTHQLRSRVDRR